MIDNNKLELTNVESATEGCNCAVIVHGLIECPITKKLSKTKLVVMFDSNELDFSSVEGHASQIMKGHSASLAQSVLYNIKGGLLKRATVKWKACLYKTIYGFMPNNDKVTDCRIGFNRN